MTATTRAAPHARHPGNAARLLSWFVVASLPVAAAGLWAEPARLPGVAAQLVTALAVSALWARLFARDGRRAMDPAWIPAAWLLVLLVPPATPLWLIAVAASFGLVLGHHVFGGTGRALVSPALLGALMIHFAYPAMAAAQGAGQAATGNGWSALVLQPGAPLGAASPLACLAGALLLVRVGAASPRLLLGGIAGIVAAAWALDAGRALAPWYLQPVAGSFAFALAFIATDPGTGALTRAGRWIHGLLIGALTAVIRVLDPAHPDGALFAVLMAGLAVPLVDYIVMRCARWRT